MSCVHHTLAAPCLHLLALLVNCHGVGLVVGKENHVRPLLHHCAGVAFRRVDELQLPAVVGAHFIGLLELADSCVSRQDNVDAPLPDVVEEIEYPPHFLVDVAVALAVAEVLNAGLVILVADRLNAQALRPVDSVDDKCLAAGRVVPDFREKLHQHCKAGGSLRPGYVHSCCAALGVDEQRIREAAGKGALADALRTVDHHLQRLCLYSSCDLHRITSFINWPESALIQRKTVEY